MPTRNIPRHSPYFNIHVDRTTVGTITTALNLDSLLGQVSNLSPSRQRQDNTSQSRVISGKKGKWYTIHPLKNVCGRPYMSYVDRITIKLVMEKKILREMVLY